MFLSSTCTQIVFNVDTLKVHTHETGVLMGSIRDLKLDYWHCRWNILSDTNFQEQNRSYVGKDFWGHQLGISSDAMDFYSRYMSDESTGIIIWYISDKYIYNSSYLLFDCVL